jgi:SAM-dependent methyltransferase
MRIAVNPINDELASHLGYTLRRHFVDSFHKREIPKIAENSLVLDFGGNRIRKRGFFDIGSYNLDVTTVDLSRNKVPDIQAEATALPIRDSVFDAVICSELLEHVSYPPQVLAEAHRVLKKGGILLVCAPFLNRIHADPYDYGRYTDYYWLQTLETAGFGNIEIEKQGLFWSVLMDMVRDLIYTKLIAIEGKPLYRLGTSLFGAARRFALRKDAQIPLGSNLSGFTTGFGIRAIKA